MPTFDTLFSGASKTTTPWPQAGRRKGERLLPDDVSERLSLQPPRLVEVEATVATSGSIDELADRLRSGSPVTVNTTDAAAAILHTCGLSRR